MKKITSQDITATALEQPATPVKPSPSTLKINIVYDVAMQQHDYQPDQGGTAKTIVTIFTRFLT